LGEFWPSGKLFTLGRFFKITEVAKLFGLRLSMEKVTYEFILTKNGLGYIKNSSR
jgi:hypothetical protein